MVGPGRVDPRSWGHDHGPMAPFRMGRLDHVHINVPDQAVAAEWYREHLGFERVAAFDFWADQVEGGPWQISADGGQSGLALFELPEGRSDLAQRAGVAFSVDAEAFATLARSLPGELRTAAGQPLAPDDLIDFDLCWAYNFADPWGNCFEINCYDYDTVRRTLVEADGITPVRLWPADLKP